MPNKIPKISDVLKRVFLKFLIAHKWALRFYGLMIFKDIKKTALFK